MDKFATIGLSTALAAALRQGYQQYKQYKLEQVPEEQQEAYLRDRRIKSNRFWNLAQYILGGVFAIIVLLLFAGRFGYLDWLLR